ncbi:Hsp33 family molecular chaperone [Emcibacter sp. SYSU 3D8]|uniref:Hsp33 family molecular chaperone n=1 Tax=Emcibacter sp. SYSU 3D8 TaxID=3133969 RepID=UPI0031FF0735
MPASASLLGGTADDVIQPFQIEGAAVRGRVVRLGPLVDDILNRHAYPDGVASLLAHALAMTALLGSAIKFEGKLIMQAKGDGAVKTIVVDYRTPGEMRGWVAFDQALYDAAVAKGVDPGREVPQLLGGGYLAFTIDQGPDTERYQGIVGLEGGTLAECAQKYFEDSEQLPSAVKLSAARVDGKWRAGGIMLQYLASAGHQHDDGDEDDDSWRESAILMASTRDEELVNPALTPTQVLFRLFHERGVRVFDPLSLAVFCQCSRERIEDVLAQFAGDDMSDMVVDGKIVVTCEFCSRVYEFEPPAE